MAKDTKQTGTIETLPPIKISQLPGALDLVTGMGASVYITGPSGIGKSEVVNQWAHQKRFKPLPGAQPQPYGFDVVDYRLIYRDAVDMRGLPTPDFEAGVTRNLPPAEFKFEGRPKLLFFDELPSASTQVQAACYQIFLERRIGEIALRDCDAVVAAGNRISDRGVVNRIPQPLRRRWFELSIEPDVTSWLDWAATNKLNHRVLSFARTRPDLMYTHIPDECSADFRGWTMVAKMLDHAAADDRTIPDELRYALIAGKVGRGPAVEFRAHEQLVDALPSFTDIIRNPQKTPVPKDNPAALYAIVTGLTRVADKDSSKNIMIYLNRIPAEYAMYWYTDIVRQNNHEVSALSGFGEWLKANGYLWRPNAQ